MKRRRYAHNQHQPLWLADRLRICWTTEHWRLEDEIEKWKTTAFLKGCQGVWEPAIVTEKNTDGVTGRSGGVAILTWNGILLLKHKFEADYILVGATIGWGRKGSIHIFS
eukprot:9902085-Heterocapsa_arctica.AAC.1